MKDNYRKVLSGGMLVPLLLIAFRFSTGVMGSFHRVRVDLKVRSPQLLQKKAEEMSKPFPHRSNPLSWAEVNKIAGRSKEEIGQLVTKLSNNLNGKNVKECPSRQCVVADVDVDDEELLDVVTESSRTDVSGVEDFVDRRLRQLLEDSGHDHTIISGVKRIAMPDVEDGNSIRQRRMSRMKPISFPAVDKSDKERTGAMQLQVFHAFSYDICLARSTVTKEALSDNANRALSFLLLPAICDQSENGYFSMENEKSSCPTKVEIKVTPWYAENLAVSKPITHTINTEYLEKTKKCSEYESTVCENSSEEFFFVSVASAINFGLNMTFQFKDDTVLRIVELGQLLDQGIGYYNIQINYPELDFTTTGTSAKVNPGPMITPDYGKDKYNVPKGHRGAGLGVTALFTGSPNVYSEKSLNAYSTEFDLPIPKIQLFTTDIFQGNNMSFYSEAGEPDLDVQSITSYGVGAEFGFLPGGQQAPDTDNYELFVHYREAFNAYNVTPDVLSLSYSNTGPSIPKDFDHIAKQFTAVGITVLSSSGDRGAAGSFFTGPCSSTQYFPGLPDSQAISPAGSPWILAVGATMEAKVSKSDRFEAVACMAPIGGLITSTGLIQSSEAAKLPDYQKDAVEGYLNSDAYKYWPFKGSFESPGRSIPDVAAYGNNIPIVGEGENGKTQAFNEGGTSASSPAFAGLLLQVRGALLSSSECEGIDVKFGHINPMIYWAAKYRPEAFTDITVGNNVFDGQSPGLDTAYCGFGYFATEGWDPVTGVGMMNFPGFVEAAKEWYCTGIDPPTNPPTKKSKKSSKKYKKANNGNDHIVN